MKTVWIIGILAFFALLGKATAHEHTAPHGGTLVVLGDEFAHLELVHDSKEGKLTAYVLDGEAENPIRIDQEDIELRINIKDSGGMRGGKSDFPLRLKAVSNVLTGEIQGDTSEFGGQSDRLKGVASLDAVIVSITIKDKEFKDVTFNFPKGNEDEE